MLQMLMAIALVAMHYVQEPVFGIGAVVRISQGFVCAEGEMTADFHCARPPPPEEFFIETLFVEVVACKGPSDKGEQGLKHGDIIKSINGTPFLDANNHTVKAQFSEYTRLLLNEERKQLTFVVLRVYLGSIEEKTIVITPGLYDSENFACGQPSLGL